MGIITPFNTLNLHTRAHFVQFSLIIISPGDVGDVAALQCPRGNVINEMMQATQTACNYLNLTGLRRAQRESTSWAGKYREMSPELQPAAEDPTTHPGFQLSGLLTGAPHPVTCMYIEKKRSEPGPH